jgi:hypothetical protein
MRVRYRFRLARSSRAVAKCRMAAVTVQTFGADDGFGVDRPMGRIPQSARITLRRLRDARSASERGAKTLELH